MNNKPWKENNMLLKSIKENRRDMESIKKDIIRKVSKLPTANTITPEGIPVLPSSWRED